VKEESSVVGSYVLLNRIDGYEDTYFMRPLLRPTGLGLYLGPTSEIYRHTTPTGSSGASSVKLPARHHLPLGVMIN
jgi:hypothetical protein